MYKLHAYSTLFFISPVLSGRGSGHALSYSTVRKVSSFFDRHATHTTYTRTHAAVQYVLVRYRKLRVVPMHAHHNQKEHSRHRDQGGPGNGDMTKDRTRQLVRIRSESTMIEPFVITLTGQYSVSVSPLPLVLSAAPLPHPRTCSILNRRCQQRCQESETNNKPIVAQLAALYTRRVGLFKRR